ELPAMFVLMVRSGRLADAVALLDGRAAAGPLRPVEALLLAAGRLWQGDPHAAQAVLARGPAPEASDPLAAPWREFAAQVASAVQAVESLRGSGGPRDDGRGR